MRSASDARGRRWRWSSWLWCSRSRSSRTWPGTGIVPNFCLLVVVAAALVRGPSFAATLGFFAGLMLDLAPPADHVAGRWALALVVVGFVAGLMRQDTRASATTVVATVAVASFVGTSVYALTGIVLGDAVAGFGDVLRVIVVALLWDVLLTPLVLPRRDAPVHAAGARGRAMKPSSTRDPGAERSRLRLIVVRVLVFSLFATLFARLYYLQVVAGDSYRRPPRPSRCARSWSSLSAG